MGLERDLHDLLYEHDCVIVPRWGGFLAQYRPARLDEARKVIHPPGKEVGFNRHLLRNDGLLADRLAKRDGSSFAAANAVIDAQVDLWRSQLEREGRLELSRIGIFFRDAHNTLQFDPDDRANFLKEAYGLRPMAALPVPQRTATPVPPTPVIPIHEEPAHGTRSWKWAAAASIALLLATGAYWSFSNADAPGGLWKGIAERFSAPAPTYRPDTTPVGPMTANAAVFSLPTESLGIRTLPLTENDSVTLTVDLGTPAAVAPADSTVVSVPVKTVLHKRFHVIGGCFAQPENADRLFNELVGKGFPAERLPQYGDLHPVAFGSYPDRAMALEALASIRSNGSGQAWLLVR